MLEKNRESMFVCFKNTVAAAGYQLRPVIHAEWTSSSPFNSGRVPQLFLRRYCSENSITLSADVKSTQYPTLNDLMNELLGKDATVTGFEKEIWTKLLAEQNFL